jgi:nucleotide-binding universal stress UspA family protein
VASGPRRRPYGRPVGAHLLEVLERRGIGQLDPAGDRREVAVAQVAQLVVARLLGITGGQHVHGDALGHRRHVAGVPVPSGDLERDQRDLPRPGRDGQRLLDPAHLQDVHRRRAEGDRAPDGNAVDEPAVEEVLVTDAYGRQQPGDRGGGENSLDDRPGLEPVLRGALDARGAALERNRQVLDPGVAELVVQQPAQRVVGMCVRAGPRDVAQPANRGSPEDLAGAQRGPDAGEPSHGVAGRVRGEQRAVDRAHGRPEHEIGPHRRLQQCPEHPDLGRAEHTTAPEHEGVQLAPRVGHEADRRTREPAAAATTARSRYGPCAADRAPAARTPTSDREEQRAMSIVVGYVATPEGRAALRRAAEEAKLRGVTLVVINSNRGGRDLGPEENLRHEQQLADVRKQLDEANVSSEVRQLVRGLDPSEDLIAVAEEISAEMIVIGLRKRTPVGKLILGSNAQRILSMRRARCSPSRLATATSESDDGNRPLRATNRSVGDPAGTHRNDAARSPDRAYAQRGERALRWAWVRLRDDGGDAVVLGGERR